MDAKKYFSTYDLVIKKKYEAMRCFYRGELSAAEAAKKFGYTLSAFYSLSRDFQKHLKQNPKEDYFFKDTSIRKKRIENYDEIDLIIIALRKKYFSVSDIKTILDAQQYNISESYIYRLIKNEGFDRLPRRNKSAKDNIKTISLEAPKSCELEFIQEKFNSESVGLLTFLPYIKNMGIDKAIEKSGYPETKNIKRLSAIFSFLALKLTNVRRFSSDDTWCMDRGLGMFAGLNVLPKTAWFSSYSHLVTREMNLSFLRSLHKIWLANDLLGDTSNLDFTTIPYWGEGEHLENNWSGKRRHALSSMLAVLAQSPDSGIIDYGDTNVMHKNESKIVLEYLDFYRKNSDGKDNIKFLVFDSKFTNYENLGNLNCKNIKFITIRRRGKNIVKRLQEIPKNKRKKIRVDCAGNKKRTLFVYEEEVVLKGYNSQNTKKENRETVRQISITGHGKVKPALIITNDFDLSLEEIVRKYSRRWIVEKGISEQIDFFHLNRISSSMVIKVDFDLVMSILAHNIYRIYAGGLERYEHLSDMKIYEKFIKNSGNIDIAEEGIIVFLKKKRNLPAILTAMDKFNEEKYEFLDGKKLIFKGANNT